MPDEPSAPSDERFDVVDEHDVVVGQASRAEVHRRGLKHRAVHVLVFNRRGELFLQKRSLKKDQHPGVWDSSASGHLEAGESYDACAVREVHEELGWPLPAGPEFLFKIAAGPETGQEFVRVYRGAAEGPFRLHPEEIETGQWFSPEDLEARLKRQPEAFAPAFRLIWQLFQRGDQAG